MYLSGAPGAGFDLDRTVDALHLYAGTGGEWVALMKLIPFRQIVSSKRIIS
jgi:hypothetical protein